MTIPRDVQSVEWKKAQRQVGLLFILIVALFGWSLFSTFTSGVWQSSAVADDPALAANSREKPAKGLVGRVEALERIELPVGGILPCYLTGDDEAIYQVLPREWVLCDGKRLDEAHPRRFQESDVAPHLWKAATPDLAGRFPRGVSGDQKVGSVGGDDLLPDHSHDMPAHTGRVSERKDDPTLEPDGKAHGMWLRDNGEFAVRQFKLDRDFSNNSNGNHSHFLPATKSVSGTRPSIVPRYTAVRFVMRIK
jgi:hypothetical protein